MACDWREGEWEWDEERVQPVRRRVVLLPYTIVVFFLGGLCMSFLLLFPPSEEALRTEGGLIYPGRTLMQVDGEDVGGGTYDGGGTSDYPTTPDYPYDTSQGSDYGSDYEVDYDYAAAHADMQRRWATAAPAIVSKTSTQLLTQSNRLVRYTRQASRSSTPLHSFAHSCIVRSMSVTFSSLPVQLSRSSGNAQPTLAQFLSLSLYLNPLAPIFTSLLDLVGLALPYWQGVVMPTLLFTTDGNREELRDVVLPLIGQVVHKFATVMDYAGADKL